MEQRGFTAIGPEGNILKGHVDTANGKRLVLVGLGERFPYAPPDVTPGADTKSVEVTWHTDCLGQLCLYTENDRNMKPWMSVDAFLGRITAWFDQAQQDWPDDVPILDADRYVNPDKSGIMIVYGDLESRVGQYVRFHEGAGKVVTLRLGETPPHRPKGRKRRRYAAIRDVGEISRPIRSWKDVRILVEDVDSLEQEIRDRRIIGVFLIYSRSGRSAMLPLRVTPVGEEFSISVYASASDAVEVRAYRSGPDRETLATKSVLVVGVGAVGSFLADLLARDGVGSITVKDGDRLTPGNTIRHLCDRGSIGQFKSDAVAERLCNGYGVDVLSDPTPLLHTRDVASVIEKYDLVVDATADGIVTAMLHECANIIGRTVLSVCVQNDGEVCRVDLLPPLTGEPLEPTILKDSPHPAFYEAGCGDPISPTPPHAVVKAAALAATHAIGLLTGTPLTPAGEIIQQTTVCPNG
ncbi:ThiF family adenylyltransferase [Streptomyces sp. RG80]|uniref:ThiF family adenylyltransferase n=1 Tax=Streptomyces sp. RG80 TaxID=3157340 RepID=UPI0033904E49